MFAGIKLLLHCVTKVAYTGLECAKLPWASIYIQHWGTIDRGAEVGVGCGEGVFPSGVWELLRKFFDCGSQNDLKSFDAFCVVFKSLDRSVNT